MTKKITTRASKIAKVAAIGAGVAALSAGGYYFFGPKGKQHQKKAKAWMLEMETEVEKKLKKVKSVTKPIYDKSIDSLALTYSKEYKDHAAEIKAFAQKLKGDWKKVDEKVSHVVKKVTKNAKKAVKKSA